MTVRLIKPIQDNLRFLSVEVDSQLENLQSFLQNPTSSMARRILDRSGYAYNLKMRIHSSCINKLAKSKKKDRERLTLRGVEFIATDLERITELVRDCVNQMSYVQDMSQLYPEQYQSMLMQVRRSIEFLLPALEENNTHLALEIGKTEQVLKQDYETLVKLYIDDLKHKENTEDLSHALLIAFSVHQMGEVLIHISESMISANLGQPVSFDRYLSLQSLVEGLSQQEDAFQIEPLAQTRSGSNISGLSAKRGEKEELVAIFKEGLKEKVKEERQGVESWHEIYPGLAPKILSYKKRGQSAALLIEHLPGFTFEQILLNESDQLLNETLMSLTNTLISVWDETRTKDPVSACFVRQIEKRAEDVYRIHPEFRRSGGAICGVELHSFKRLLKACDKLDEALQAPFSVYIHGDFNVDNIIYDPFEKRINFIDLHRSRYMDYVQDVSVFMVSNYRLQLRDAELRKRILQVAVDFYSVAQKYAKKRKDATFEIRLALGLARSFFTSTRFILDKSLARNMFQRATYLLEQVQVVDMDDPKSFKLPIKELFID